MKKDQQQEEKSTRDTQQQERTARTETKQSVQNETSTNASPAVQKLMEHSAFILALAAVTLLFAFLLKPFFSAIFWACALAIVFNPLQKRLIARWKRPTLATLTTLCACIILGVVPMFFILFSFAQEGTDLYKRLQSGEIDPASYVEKVKQAAPAAHEFLERFNLDLDTVKEKVSALAVGGSGFVAKNAVKIGQNTLSFFVSLSLTLYLTFYMLRDGEKLIAMLIRALPLGDEREKMLLGKFAEVTRATVRGNLAVAVVQGALGGFIFWVLGIEGAFLWGVVMTVLSLIPIVGAGLIWAPVAVYLFATGSWVDGLVLALFGACVIGLADNILRPILVGRDTKLPDYIVLLSTLGGFTLFGMNGFIIGPLVAVLFMAFWEIFTIEYNSTAPETIAGSESSNAAAGEEDGENWKPSDLSDKE